jgi:hypothetical protein
VRKVIDLDAQDPRVKEFFASLPTNGEGMEFEINGRRAIVVIEPLETTASVDWNPAKNDRRCQLIDRKIDGTLTLIEAAELAKLQVEMGRWLDQVAPLPLESARALHRELLQEAGRTGISGRT